MSKDFHEITKEDGKLGRLDDLLLKTIYRNLPLLPKRGKGQQLDASKQLVEKNILRRRVYDKICRHLGVHINSFWWNLVVSN